MKRYWKLLFLVLFAVLVIGAFYIQGSLASSGKPDYIIKKRIGDEEVIKNLVIMGSIPTGNYLNDIVHIDDTETIYESERSFIESIDNHYLFPEIKKLQQDYRNFMRGKLADPSLFYEDENHVAYAYIKWDQGSIGPTRFSFDIEVLDKDSKEVTVIQKSLPKDRSYNYANVLDVQWIDGKLKVAAEINPDINGWKSEIHLYTFDLNSQQLVKDQLINSVDEEKNPNTRVTVLSEEGNIGPKKELLIEKTKWKSVPVIGGYGEEKVDSQLILYNYETDEQKSIDKTEFQYDLVSLYDSVIYFMKRMENGIEIHPYDIKSNKFLESQILLVEMPSKISEENGGGLPVVTFKNDRIYLASPYKDAKTEASVLVADVKTWKALYEGTIEQDSPNGNGKSYSLRLYSLRVE